MLKNKNVLISGAAKGIGAVTAKHFISQGANVIIADIDIDAARLLSEALGKNAIAHKLDVVNEADWQEVIASKPLANPIDVLINNAGIVQFQTIKEQSAESFMKVIEVNLLGCYNGIRAIIPEMKAAGKGSIINISSIDGLQAKNALSAYCASKWGVRGLTKSAAIELGHHNIRVNSIHPGGIDNEMGMSAVENIDSASLNEFYKNHAIARPGFPIEVAKMACFLASDEASYSTGSEFIVDGGWNAGLSLPFLPKS